LQSKADLGERLELWKRNQPQLDKQLTTGNQKIYGSRRIKG
jgi:hypothetical protein